MGEKLEIPHTRVHHLTRHLLEPAQDVLVLGIGLALFGVMIRTLIWLVRQIYKPTVEFRGIIAEVLFMLVMVEVVRLVIIYLGEHRVAVDFMVELGIVATLREIILRGVTERAWQQIGCPHRVPSRTSNEQASDNKRPAASPGFLLRQLDWAKTSQRDSNKKTPVKSLGPKETSTFSMKRAVFLTAIPIPIVIPIPIPIVIPIPIALRVPLTFLSVPPTMVLPPATLALVVQCAPPVICLRTALPVPADRFMELDLCSLNSFVALCPVVGL